MPSNKKLIESKKITFYKNLIINPRLDKHCVIGKIFRVCHSLDLQRCYTAKEFSAATEAIAVELGVEVESKIIIELIRFATDNLKATGDKNLALGRDRIPELFVACSTDVKKCLRALEGVTPPALTVANATAAVPIKQIPKEVPPQNAAKSIYEKGVVLYQQQKYSEALQLFIKAEGLADAQYMAGMCYYKGRGTQIDYNNAHNYFSLSANQHHSGALYMKGICCYYGQGRELDKKRAKDYFILADQRGSAEAKKILLELFK